MLCSSCGLDKAESEFDKNPRNKKRGFYNQCRKCLYVNYGKHRRDYKLTIRGRISSALAKAKARADKVELPFDITLDYLVGLYDAQKGLCALSGLPMTNDARDEFYCMSLDKIVPELGYVMGNVQFTCRICNIMKWNLPMPDFTRLVAVMNNHLNVGGDNALGGR